METTSPVARCSVGVPTWEPETCFSFAFVEKTQKNSRERPANHRFVGAKQPIPMGSTGALAQFLKGCGSYRESVASPAAGSVGTSRIGGRAP